MLLALCIPLLTLGCANSPSQKTPLTYTGDVDQEIELVGQVMSSGTFHDHTLRLLGYVLHPMGVLLDYALIRSAHLAASQAPTVFGYTVEDAAFVGSPTPTHTSG